MGQESVIQRDVIQYLTMRGFLAWRNHIQGIRLNGRRLKNPNIGQPDVWAVMGGQLLGVEVKSSAGRLSSEQSEWIKLAQLHGVPIIVAHSVTELHETLIEIWDDYFPMIKFANA